jgi:hypothetical protein
MRFLTMAVGYFIMVVATAIATMALIDLMAGNVEALVFVVGVWGIFTLIGFGGYTLLRSGSLLGMPSAFDPSTYLLLAGVSALVFISNLIVLGLALMGLFSRGAPSSTSWGLLVFATGMVVGSFVALLLSLERHRDSIGDSPQGATPTSDASPASQAPEAIPLPLIVGTGYARAALTVLVAVGLMWIGFSLLRRGDSTVATPLPFQGSYALVVVLLGVLIMLILVVSLLATALRSRILVYVSLAVNLVMGVLAVTMAIVVGVAVSALGQIAGLLLIMAFFVVYLSSLVLLVVEARYQAVAEFSLPEGAPRRPESGSPEADSGAFSGQQADVSDTR